MNINIPLILDKADIPDGARTSVTAQYMLPIDKGHFGDRLDVVYRFREASGVWAIDSASIQKRTPSE